MRIQLPPPRSWEEFEGLAFQLWKSIWFDHNAQLHGRHGQPQSGVDIYGRPFAQSHWEGVQCKGKDRLTRKKVTVDELRDEAGRAASFTPQIASFVLATTAPRDAAIQAEAARMTNDEAAKFRVSVWSWDDIEEELNFRDYLLPSLYPYLRAAREATGTTTIGNRLYVYRAQPIERSFSFLSHPEVMRIYPVDMRVDLRNLVFELALNAFEHGLATRVGVTVESDGSLQIADDGNEYDVMARRGDSANVGLLYLSVFIEKYDGTFAASYSRTQDKENLVRLSLVQGAKLGEALSSRIILFDDDALMPSKARFIARTAVIPQGFDVIDLELSSMVFSPSSLHEFLQELLKHIDPAITLRVSCGHQDLIARCVDLWNRGVDREHPEFKGRFIVVSS